MRTWVGVLTVGVLALAAACAPAVVRSGGAPSGGSQSGPQAVTLTARDLNFLNFSPAQLTLKAEQPIRLTLVNEGAVEHDLNIEGVNASGQAVSMGGHDAGHGAEAEAGTVHVSARTGEQASVEFTPKAGTYEFYCSMPGHKEAGMKGMFTVE